LWAPRPQVRGSSRAVGRFRTRDVTVT